MIAATFREKVLLEMHRRNLTWSELADLCGYHRVSLSRWLHGRQESPRLRHAIALALSIPPEES